MAVTAAPAVQDTTRWGNALAAVLAVGVAALQITYARVEPGPALNALTIATVVVFFCSSAVHAAATRGLQFAALLVAITGGGGLLVEAIGVASGIPFGTYAYTGTLGPSVLDVPVVIGMAWTMMGYPAYVVGSRITSSRRLRPVLAGAALAAWDLFLDPQMVDAGHWRWAGTSGPELLGVPAVNFIGWFAAATIMMTVLFRAVPARSADDRVPLALYVWTYVSSVLAHALYFDLPGSAAVGGLAMGAVVLLLVLSAKRVP